MKAYSLFMASQKGFEPPTPRLGGACSIQLSYWDKCHYSFFIPHLDPNDLPLRRRPLYTTELLEPIYLAILPEIRPPVKRFHAESTTIA